MRFWELIERSESFKNIQQYTTLYIQKCQFVIKSTTCIYKRKKVQAYNIIFTSVFAYKYQI